MRAPENSEATTADLIARGLIRVGYHGQQKHIVQGADHQILLTNGVDGFGRQTSAFAVVLLGKSNDAPGRVVLDSIDLTSKEQFTADTPRRMGTGPGITTWVNRADVDAATADLIRRHDLKLHTEPNYPAPGMFADWKHAFSARLRALREAYPMTAEELAQAAGTTRQTIHNLEAGKTRPSWESVQKLAEALGTTTDTFRGE